MINELNKTKTECYDVTNLIKGFKGIEVTQNMKVNEPKDDYVEIEVSSGKSFNVTTSLQ